MFKCLHTHIARLQVTGFIGHHRISDPALPDGLPFGYRPIPTRMRIPVDPTGTIHSCHPQQ